MSNIIAGYQVDVAPPSLITDGVPLSSAGIGRPLAPTGQSVVCIEDQYSRRSGSLGDKDTNDACWLYEAYQPLQALGGLSSQTSTAFNFGTTVLINPGVNAQVLSTSIGSPGAWVGYVEPPVATPEPSTMLLMGAALVAVSLWKRFNF